MHPAYKTFKILNETQAHAELEEALRVITEELGPTADLLYKPTESRTDAEIECIASRLLPRINAFKNLSHSAQRLVARHLKLVLVHRCGYRLRLSMMLHASLKQMEHLPSCCRLFVGAQQPTYRALAPFSPPRSQIVHAGAVRDCSPRLVATVHSDYLHRKHTSVRIIAGATSCRATRATTTACSPSCAAATPG